MNRKNITSVIIIVFIVILAISLPIIIYTLFIKYVDTKDFSSFLESYNISFWELILYLIGLRIIGMIIISIFKKDE